MLFAFKGVLRDLLQELKHTTKVNSDIASSYFGAASAEDHPEVLNTLAEMVHARAEPRCITFFLTDKLAAQEEGSDVNFFQDQLDITTAIVCQTKQQKKRFKLWGDCLVM
ncbi:hypothetical protein PInf_016362 [Phytophthora infestans]|nr:hypothetical protein PInf_016362 [Phytophthora infestans]